MTELNLLLTTAISIAFIHTIIGIDHYIPFIVLSRANNWTVKKTLLIVFICGFGHVATSIALGFAGIALSAGVSFLIDIESIRGEIATYFLIAFGLVYTAYGIRNAAKNKTHRHITPDGRAIRHAHAENGEGHGHSVADGKKSTNVFWGLFILLVLGPCEPLIPLVMYPAVTQNTFALISVTASFAVCTIATMLLATYLGLKGIRFLKMDKLERYSHALAGSAILACGIAVLALPI
jgi:sulfite exporter TauE/SafE